MEIDEAVRQSTDRRLQTKYESAVYVIQRAFALYAFEEVAFSFNGGKDSTVLLHLLRAGYFLHKEKTKTCNGIQMNYKPGCPIRTIYFESPSAFPEINSFTYETANTYNLPLEIIRLDFKGGLEALLNEKPIKAIFLGTRIGDPNAVGQEQFSPSSPGWPPFMRVNPILDWSYRDVWAFLLTCKVQYCSLYDQGYTSIGSIYDTVPNALLSIGDSSTIKEKFRPAYLLADGRLERAGRAKRIAPPTSIDDNFVANGLKSMESCLSGTLTAAIVAIGDEILLGAAEEHVSSALCRKLQAIGWTTMHVSVVQNDIDAVAEEVEHRKSTNDMVFLFGGVGPLHSDVTVAGVAKAFGVRTAPDEEFEEYLTHLMGEEGTGNRNEMAQLPEGVTELLHHQILSVPLIKCQNVIILSATNLSELEKEWNCLLELTSSSGPLLLMAPFVTKHLSTTLSDVKISKTLSAFCLEFPDLYIGCYRKSRKGPLIVSFRGKDEARVDFARQKLCQMYGSELFSEVNCG
ncbi:hypothetical protein H6P81_017534 [Aristolochia fimbriata]|uniref:FAD synthase n=1 Tax=Aristolochia fimbriata TaxID=158543 RepID=A0AAV7DYD5_ARIFI|nr:hypothetical protein H6P81_017534 [Aristolochia fimbriata]